MEKGSRGGEGDSYFSSDKNQKKLDFVYTYSPQTGSI